MRERPSYNSIWFGAALFGSIALATPTWAARTSTPDGFPQVKHNVTIPAIKNAKKNPNPTPTSKTITLRNSGDAPLTGIINLPSVSGEPFVCTTGCVPFSLAPGQTTTFTLAFAPSSKGNYHDLLMISSNSARRPSVKVKMHASAKQGVPGGVSGIGGGGGTGSLPPPLTGCDVPTGSAQNGSGSPSPAGSTAESLLDTLTATSNGVLPELSQFANSTAGGASLDSLPVLGEITASPSGALSGLPITGSSVPTLGSLTPDPSTIPVLGTLVDQEGGNACTGFNSVIPITGPCGQVVGALLGDGTSGLTDVASVEAAIGQFENQFTSESGLSQIASNPSQVSGLLTEGQSGLTALGESLQPLVTGGATECAMSLPSACSPSQSTLSQLESLAPTTPGDVAPTLSQLEGSLPSGASLSSIPVVGAIVTGSTAQLLPSSLPAPTLGSLTGGSSLAPSIPVLGSIPLGSGASQVDALLGVVSGSQVVGVVPVLGASGTAPDPSTIITQLQAGDPCSDFASAISQITQSLTAPSLSSPLTGQIGGVSGLSSELSTVTTNLSSVVPGLGSLL